MGSARGPPDVFNHCSPGSSDSVEQVMDQVEKYIMTRLYKSVFCPETTDDEKKDLATQNRIRWAWSRKQCCCLEEVTGFTHTVKFKAPLYFWTVCDDCLRLVSPCVQPITQEPYIAVFSYMWMHSCSCWLRVFVTYGRNDCNKCVGLHHILKKQSFVLTLTDMTMIVCVAGPYTGWPSRCCVCRWMKKSPRSLRTWSKQ